MAGFLARLTHRVANEQTAVRAALASNVTNADLRALNVYRADGSLNEGHALVSALCLQHPLRRFQRRFCTHSGR